jgi:electron transport complex protein RnfC
VTAACADGPAVAIQTSQGAADTEARATGLLSTSPRDAAQLADIADRAGITDFRRPASGLGDQLRRAAASGVRDIIINGLPHEPLVTAGRELLRQHVGTVLATAMRLRDALHVERLWIAVDKSDRNLLNHCRQAAHGHAVQIAAVANKYPQAAPVLLVWAVTRRQTPIGRLPEENGALVLEVEPLLALADAARIGRPLTHRVVNVVGPAVARPGPYRVPVGTSFADVLRHVGLARSVARIIAGGPLTGTAIETPDAVVTKQTAAVLVMDHEHERAPVPGPCIRCGWCQDVCPVGLDPQMLLNAAERDDIGVALSLQPGACLACGLCSYVCPAELPLSQAAIRWKGLATQDV